MAESNTTPNNNIFSENDPLDINELASLNEEISADFIEQLQNQIAASANIKNDGDLFEEPAEEKQESSADVKLEESKEETLPVSDTETTQDDTVADAMGEQPVGKEEVSKLQNESIISENDSAEAINESIDNKKDIEAVSGGNITERPITKENVEYSQSLDYIDDNVNYSKYVIYIAPENKDFIDSLTVKERKNIINRILKEQDSIAVTKRKLAKMQTVITHLIVAILTIVIAVPCIYWAINASLEATINNYRASQSNFGQLYREHGKIKTQSNLK